MKPTELANNYDKIADHWSGSRFNRNNGIAQHMRALQLSSSSGKAIDIGCGSSGRLIELIQEHGLAVEGLDFSNEMLKHAKVKHPDIVFHHADICEWNFVEQYDFISAWDSIWHVPLEYQELVILKLCHALADNGVLIFTSGAVDEAGDGSNPFLGQELYHTALGISAILKILNDCNCVCRHLENDDWPNPHLYIIAQRKET